MKRFLFIPLVTLIALFLFIGVRSDNGVYALGHEEYILYAGQDIPVGYVDVSNDYENIYVHYFITEPDWCLTETHVQIGKTLGDFPLAGRQGNPVPGQFDYKKEHYPCVTDYEYEIPLGDYLPGENLKIATHGAIQRIESEYIDFDSIVVDSGEIEGSYTNEPLIDGEKYLFIASGWWRNGSVHSKVDAECRLPVGEIDWKISAPGSLRLKVNEDYFSWITEDETGCDPYNTYSGYFVGEGDYVNFRINDGEPPRPEWYGDNDGNINVDIYRIVDHIYTESVWGADSEMLRFTERGNWATYFNYEVQDHQSILLSVLYEGYCDRMGSHLDDLLTLTFSNDIFLVSEDPGTKSLSFNQSSNVGDNVFVWKTDGNVLTIETGHRVHGNPRPKIGEYLNGIVGVVDSQGNPVVVDPILVEGISMPYMVGSWQRTANRIVVIDNQVNGIFSGKMTDASGTILGNINGHVNTDYEIYMYYDRDGYVNDLYFVENNGTVTMTCDYANGTAIHGNDGIQRGDPYNWEMFLLP